MIFIPELDNQLSIYNLGFIWLDAPNGNIWKTDYHDYVAIGANHNHIEK